MIDDAKRHLQLFVEEVESDVRAIRDLLAAVGDSSGIEGFIRDALAMSVETSEQRALSLVQSLTASLWRSPLFARALNWDVALLQEFSNDVKRFAPSTFQGMITQDCQAHVDEWEGLFFELSVKSRLSAQRQDVKFDVPVCAKSKESRNSDVSLLIGDREFRMECTALTLTKEDKAHWANLRARPLISDDVSCASSVNRKGNTHKARRVFLKVFDKLAKKLDPKKTQISANSPNVLLLGFPHPPDIGPEHEGVRRAIHELLAPWPERSRGEYDQMPEFKNSLFIQWMDYYADELQKQGKIRWKSHYADFPELVTAPRRIGAIILFEQNELSRAILNYNVLPQCAISHREIAEIEKLLRCGEPGWSRKLRL